MHANAGPHVLTAAWSAYVLVNTAGFHAVCRDPSALYLVPPPFPTDHALHPLYFLFTLPDPPPDPPQTFLLTWAIDCRWCALDVCRATHAAGGVPPAGAMQLAGYWGSAALSWIWRRNGHQEYGVQCPR